MDRRQGVNWVYVVLTECFESDESDYQGRYKWVYEGGRVGNSCYLSISLIVISISFIVTVVIMAIIIMAGVLLVDTTACSPQKIPQHQCMHLERLL